MKIKDKIVVVTGGADGIGKALCERFHKEGAKAVIVADLNGDKAAAVAKSVGGKAYKCDVANDQARRRLFSQYEFGGGAVVANRQRRLRDDQACRGGVRRNPRDHASRPGHSRFDALSARRRHPAVARRQPRPATSRWR